MKRRTFLIGFGSFGGLSALTWIKRNELIRWGMTHRVTDSVLLTSHNGSASVTCQMNPEQTEGPFKVAAPLRSNIQEDRKGLPLSINIQLLTENTCASLSSALVEIWHCDAAGGYSGYPESLARKPFDTMKLMGMSDPNNTHVAAINSKIYLRGAQQSNTEGRVHFKTIFPGWYDPRVTHIHIAVTVNNKRRFSSQIYFPMDFANQIYANHPEYKDYGLCPYQHKTDPVLARYPNAEGLLVIPQQHGEGVKAEVTLVLGATSA